MKKIYYGFTTGIFIGLIVSAIFSFLYHNTELRLAAPQYYASFPNELSANLVGFAIFGLIGVFSSYASLLFERMEVLWKATLLHYFITLILVLVLGKFMKWFQESSPIYAILSISLIYIIIYIISYFYHKWESKRMTEKLWEQQRAK